MDGMSATNEEARKAYIEFQEKVKRTVFLDNLSPQVTDQVIRTAIGQFGGVSNVEFITNYTIPFNIPKMALVEMENAKQVEAVVAELSNYPFMMSGGPRPVRALQAKAEMFADRPSPPDRKINVRWVNPSDPDFGVAKRLKRMVRRHQAETQGLVKLQLDEEEKLANQQAEMLKANYKKFEIIDKVMNDTQRAGPRLASYYGFHIGDE